jgi:RNA polymerase sigma-70 factor (ECF subfamily)
VQVVARQGRENTEEFRALYEQEFPRLWRALLAWSGSRQVAEDAASEAFAQALGRSDLRDPAAWVWRVGFRLAGRELGRRGSTSPLPEGHDPADPTDRHALSAGTIDLLDGLSVLSHQQRGALVLTAGFGLSSSEAAELLDTTPVTVRVQAHRARRRLRNRLSTSEVPAHG